MYQETRAGYEFQWRGDEKALAASSLEALAAVAANRNTCQFRNLRNSYKTQILSKF
jgi:hypothetical protein